MSVFVNTNVSSLNAQRQMFNSSLSLDTAFKRLSSGFRINSAADDAAGLQISNRLTTQINGNEMAIRNANDAISLAQVAEGAMEESTSAMQRMRTLAIQANNGINSQADREALNKELQALKTEMERIAQTTTFGSVNVLTAGFEGNFLIGANASQRDYFMITDLNAQTANLGQVELSSRPAPAPGAYTMLAGGLNLVGQPIVLNEVPFEQNYNRPEEFVAQVNSTQFPNNEAQVTARLLPFQLQTQVDLASLPTIFEINGSPVNLNIDPGALGWSPGADTPANSTIMNNVVSQMNAVAQSQNLGFVVERAPTANPQSPASNGLIFRSLDGSSVAITGYNPGAPSPYVPMNNLLVDIEKGVGNTGTVHFGGIEFNSQDEKFSNIDISGPTLNDFGIYPEDLVKNTIDTLDVLTPENAERTLRIIDIALGQIDAQRSELGAQQNSLTGAIRNLSNVVENVSGARSRIRDTDFAKETAELTRAQILQQTSQTVLAQANQRPQAALSLLQG